MRYPSHAQRALTAGLPTLGAPFVESKDDQPRFTAPLTGITAAVAGVVVNLAVFFAYQVLWPAGLAGRFEWPPAMIGIAAAFALLRMKAGVIAVVAAGGLAGLALNLLRPPII